MAGHPLSGSSPTAPTLAGLSWWRAKTYPLLAQCARSGYRFYVGQGALTGIHHKIDTPGWGVGHVDALIFYPARDGGGGDQQPEQGWKGLLYLHGGGFVLGSPDTENRKLQDLADQGFIVVSLDYAKGPRHPFPHALEQAFKVLQWISQSHHILAHDDEDDARHFHLEKESYALSNGKTLHVDPTRLYLQGVSSGGNLAIALCHLLQHQARKGQLAIASRVRAVVVHYPPVDIDHTYEEKVKAGSHPEFIGLKGGPVAFLTSFMNDCYLPPPADRRDPLVSPWFLTQSSAKRDLDFPATLFIWAENDLLTKEGEEFARWLKENKVDVATKTYPGVGHNFSLDGLLPPSRFTRQSRETLDRLKEAAVDSWIETTRFFTSH